MALPYPWALTVLLLSLIAALRFEENLQTAHLFKDFSANARFALEFVAIFFLCQLANQILRQVFLLILLMPSVTSDAADFTVRLFLVLFPSIKPAGSVMEHVSQAWHQRKGAHDKNEKNKQKASPAPLTRTATFGGGALKESITVEELPSVPHRKTSALEREASGANLLDDADADSTVFRSVLFVEETDAARVALPPLGSFALMLTSVTLHLAITIVYTSYHHPQFYQTHVPDLLTSNQYNLLGVAAFLRVLIPFDFALTAIIDDMVAAQDLSSDASAGFGYFALAMRCIVWLFAATTSFKLLGLEIGSTMLTAWGFFGFGLTLSLQSTAKDLFSTLQLFATRPYAIGELVDAGQGHFGHVVEVGWRFTTMQLLSSNQHIAIPNVALADTRIQNYSRMEKRRGSIELDVVADTPVETLRLIPGLITQSAIEQGLEVVWCCALSITQQGIHYQAVVRGPPGSIEFDTLKQNALFALLEQLAAHEVKLNHGMSGGSVAPKSGSKKKVAAPMAATMKVVGLAPSSTSRIGSGSSVASSSLSLSTDTLPRLSEGTEGPQEMPRRSLSSGSSSRRRQQSMWARRPSLSGGSMLSRSSEAGTFQ